MIKNIYLAIATLALVASSSAQAEDMNSDACHPSFSASASYLLWRPCRGELYLSDGINGVDDIENTQYLNPGYNSGVRVEGQIYSDYLDYGVRVTYFSSDDEFSRGTTTRFYDLEYGAVDAEIGYSFYCESAFTLRPFVGFRTFWIDEKLGLKGPELDPPYTRTEKARGLGLYAGIQGRYQFCKCIPLALLARADTALLNSEFKTDSTDPESSNSHREKERVYMSQHTIFAGIQWTIPQLMCAEMLIGYEAQIWGTWRESNSQDDLVNLGFGGLVVKGGFSF